MATTSTEQPFDTLRAMTKVCPCCGGKGDHPTEYPSPAPCLQCNGTGSVPRFAMMFETKHQSWIGPTEPRIVLGVCDRCDESLVLVDRTPTSDEVEDALMELSGGYEVVPEGDGCRLWADPDWHETLLIDEVGTDPRNARLKALLALAQGDSE